MDPNVIQIAFGVVLTTLTGAVGWLIVTVITNARKVAVLENQIKGVTEIRIELGQIHRRVDDLVSATAQISGQMAQSNRTGDLILEHLLGEKA